jgi:hypothetical protein
MRWRPTLSPGILTDDVFVVGFDPALLDLIEQKFKGHQFGETCRRNQLIAVLVVQDTVAFGVEQNCRGCAALKSLLFFARAGRCGLSNHQRGKQG